MDRSLKSATFLIVMVSLVLGGSVNSLAQRFGFESGEGRPGRGGRLRRSPCRPWTSAPVDHRPVGGGPSADVVS